jgi:hypothetical protein
VSITNEFHEFYLFIISGTSDDEKTSYRKKIHAYLHYVQN